jgi:hypothetical protein
MRLVLTSAALTAMIVGSAFAATTPNDNAPSNPAVKTTDTNNPGAPASGANSFTMGQAKSRIEAKGYGNVTGLAKDDKGVWHGKAMKDGKSTDVALDYQGNVVTN